jgi:nuclear transport factor 2 (NTF2) superfamily protein
MVTDSQRDYLERFVTAWNAHDVEAIGALYAEDAIMEDSGLFDGRLNGRDAIKDYYVRQWEQTPQGHQLTHAVGANENQIFVHWEWVPGDDYDGLSVEGVSIWTLEDGVMKADITHFNPTRMRAAGLQPAFTA